MFLIFLIKRPRRSVCIQLIDRLIRPDHFTLGIRYRHAQNRLCHKSCLLIHRRIEPFILIRIIDHDRFFILDGCIYDPAPLGYCNLVTSHRS